MELKGIIKKVLREELESVQRQLRSTIEEDINSVKTDYKPFLDKSKGILNPYPLLDKFKNYLISRIPEVIQQLKTGKGGAKFGYECFIFIKKLVEEEVKNLNSVKKLAIKNLGGGKESIKQKLMNTDISDYYNIFGNIMDFGFAIGWMNEMEKYEDNILKWSSENIDWVNKNKKYIKIDIVNTIVNNL